MTLACGSRTALLALALITWAATAFAQSAITGSVLENGKPVAAATVSGERSDKSPARESITDSDGRFRLAPLSAGLYTVTVRKVGYRPAELVAVRVAEGQTVNLVVALTQAPRQLSTIRIVASPTSVNASTPELTHRLDRDVTSLLPSARDASSLIALIPGARKEQLWGGVPGVSNDYRLDGMSMNHPGAGGDFLSLSVDWIDALDVRGLGAGAEDGNFQGGIINAITKTGTNDRRLTFRSNYESARLTATNVRPGEEGVEQAGRYELGGEALGPIARDKLFYFVAGQMVRRDLRAPNLSTPAPRDFQSFREEHLDARALGKLTWLPALGQRVDGLVGLFRADVEHAGINGIDDPVASVRARKPTVVYELGWNNTAKARNAIDVKLAGFTASESRLGYQGPAVPGVQLLQPGRLPSFQNAAFDERSRASSMSGRATWRMNHSALGAAHELILGADVSHTWWRDERTRNGGVTWRPYSFVTSNFDPVNAATWGVTASDWGGDIHLDSDAASAALFVQDYVAIGSRLTVTPGVRFGQWSGYLRPWCPSAGATRSLSPSARSAGGSAVHGDQQQILVHPQAGTRASLTEDDLQASPCERFEAVHADAVDPRIGVVWDVTGRSTLALKAHWGRYHQGMVSLLFDRARGANVYTNHRMYYTAPPFIDSRTTFTTAQRDDSTFGFSRYFGEEVLDETGRVDGYKQPYVEQTVLGAEKSLGSRWKAEVVYTHRRNRDIVGLVDRNRGADYARIYNLHVNDQFTTGRTLDANGKPLVLPMVYVSNKDLKEQLLLCAGVPNAPSCPSNIAGYTLASPLPWSPDFVLTTIPEARRSYDQFTVLLRTNQARWRGEGSITSARLRGNVPGVTGHGTTGTRFSAGPFAKPNESINNDGPLPDALELEGKVWLAMRLPRSFEGGVLYTHTLGERFTAAFQFDGRYAYTDSLGAYIPPAIFRSLLGQTVFVEPRGSRHYASRDVVDLHLEWRSPKRAVLMFDLFNALGTDALTSVNAVVGNQIDADPTSYFMAARQRASPRTLRVGLRMD